MMIFKNNLLGFPMNARSNNYSSTYESKDTSLGMYLRTILSSIYVYICNWYLSLTINSVSIVDGRYGVSLPICNDDIQKQFIRFSY